MNGCNGGKTYTQVYDAENRLVSVTVDGETTQFIYDRDDNLAKKVLPDGGRVLYESGVYEVEKHSGGTVIHTTVYYPVGGVLRVDGTLYYVLGDHLGSASITLDANDNLVEKNRH